MFYAEELNQPWSDWTVTPMLRQGMWNKILNETAFNQLHWDCELKRMSYLKTAKKNSYPQKTFTNIISIVQVTLYPVAMVTAHRGLPVGCVQAWTLQGHQGHDFLSTL